MRVLYRGLLTKRNLVQKTGYVIPIAIFSLVLSSIGTGLMSTLQADSAVGRWVGFQILAGVGSGAGLQLVSFSPPPQHSTILTDMSARFE